MGQSETFQDFLLPIKTVYENERVVLMPWDNEKHARLFYAGTKSHPSTFEHMLWGPFSHVESLRTLLHPLIATDPTRTLFAVYARDGIPDRDGAVTTNDDERFVGTIGLLNADKANASAEIGGVTLLPKWRRTCVHTHAVGLLLLHLLDPLPPFGEGLGLRRVQWRCNALNRASRDAAERLGFVLEGVTRWSRVLRKDKHGMEVPNQGRMYGSECKGINSCTFSIVWDEWEGEKGTREKLIALMFR